MCYGFYTIAPIASLYGLFLYLNIVNNNNDYISLTKTNNAPTTATAITAEDYKSKFQFFKLKNCFIAFKEHIGFKESQGRYNEINTLGYLGKYQFGEETLNTLGVTNIDYFLSSPKLQEKIFLKNIKRNKKILADYINQFDGVVLNNIKVTESGILAAAHLAGPGGVKKYLKRRGKVNISDAYGSSVKHYLKQFSGYNTSTI